MITVEVVSVGGGAPSRPISAAFQDGGTIGRSPDCTLVLPDDKRAVSRVHARLVMTGGQCLIADEGVNPVKLNGAPLGKGASAPVKDGDRLIIGPYELEVRMEASLDDLAAMPIDPGDPFGDLLNPTPTAITGLGSEPPPRMPGVAPRTSAPPPPMPAPSSSDPFADLGFGSSSSSSDLPGFGNSSSSGGSPFDDLMGSPAPEPRSSPRAPMPPPQTSGHGGGVLPDDFDLMAAPAAAPPAQLPGDFGGFPDDFDPLSASPKAPGGGSLDELFGLSPGGSSPQQPSGGLLAGPSPSGGLSNDSGLTKWLGGIAGGPAAAPVQDQVPELNAAFTPPKAMTPTPPPRPAPPPPPKAAPPMPPPQIPATDSTRGQRPAPPQMRPRVPAPRAAPAAPAPRRDRSVTPATDLAAAFLAGLDAQDLELDDLSPEFMHKLGVLLHEATRGTLALLVARGTVKRELRADVTMISSGRNNPLKFSPDARIALRYLLGPQMPGFMESEEAMRDAYNDLRAHEFGFMAGMRAALTGVLARFSPERIEARLPEKGGIGGLLAANRRAKLWDMFNDHYRQMVQEAEEDFHALFGREFLRAYEEHVSAVDQQSRHKG